MGTEISLDVGGATIDWSKNHRGVDHGALFQLADKSRTFSDQIDYDYFTEKDDPDLVLMETGFSKPLKDVVPRLELLGYSLEKAEAEYDRAVSECMESLDYSIEYMTDEQVAHAEKDIMSFAEFVEFVKQHAIAELDDTFISFDTEDAKKKLKGRFTSDVFTKRIPEDHYGENNAFSELSYFINLIGIMHPYSLLILLAQIENNHQTLVTWQYGPLVNAGWANESEFVAGAKRKETFLIATEGRSDTLILKHAIELLRPAISDFFSFIDVSERHPFSGAGNLVKFAEGLAKIDIHNQVLFVLDNDVEGKRAYAKIGSMDLPSNMRAMALPDLECFRSFPAHGPDGIVNTDINGSAVAIECFLDLDIDGAYSPEVRWTSYQKDVDSYQGELRQKEVFTRHFLKQTSETIGKGQYSIENLEYLLEAIISECRLIANSNAG